MILPALLSKKETGDGYVTCPAGVRQSPGSKEWMCPQCQLSQHTLQPGGFPRDCATRLCWGLVWRQASRGWCLEPGGLYFKMSFQS